MISHIKDDEERRDCGKKLTVIFKQTTKRSAFFLYETEFWNRDKKKNRVFKN